MDLIRAGIKTAVAAAVGWLAARGIDVDQGALELVLIGLAGGVVNIILNGLTRWLPFLEKIGWKAPAY